MFWVRLGGWVVFPVVVLGHVAKRGLGLRGVAHICDHEATDLSRCVLGCEPGRGGRWWMRDEGAPCFTE